MFRVDKVDYFDKFHCIMGQCPANCCEMNWNILVDDAAYEKYQACEDEKVRNFISQETPHKIVTKDRKCPFYQTDGLCMLHKEYGEDFLCETCRSYPRFTLCYGDWYIVSLAPSCPAVLDILWDQEKTEIKTDTFYESQDDLRKGQMELSEELEAGLQLRTKMLEIVWDREISLGERVNRLREILGNTALLQDLAEASEWTMHYVNEKCLNNEEIKAQSRIIAKSVLESVERCVPDMIQAYPEFQRFFEHILVYSIFGLPIEGNGEKDKREWLEKICLRLATIQYWLLFLYGARGEVSRKECNTATYSIMRILDHNEKEWERYYGAWKREHAGVPIILW